MTPTVKRIRSRPRRAWAWRASLTSRSQWKTILHNRLKTTTGKLIHISSFIQTQHKRLTVKNALIQYCDFKLPHLVLKLVTCFFVPTILNFTPTSYSCLYTKLHETTFLQFKTLLNLKLNWILLFHRSEKVAKLNKFFFFLFVFATFRSAISYNQPLALTGPPYAGTTELVLSRPQ